MNRQPTVVVLLLSALALVPVAGAQGSDPFASTDGSGEAVELVIALDVSDSMEPLIETTRLELWEIVNSVALRRQHLVAQVEDRGPDQTPGFDDAVQRMLHDELRQRGFEVSD